MSYNHPSVTKISIVFAFFLLMCLIASLFNSKNVEFTKEDGVFVLTDKNFDYATGIYDNILIEIYAPWYIKKYLYRLILLFIYINYLYIYLGVVIVKN